MQILAVPESATIAGRSGRSSRPSTRSRTSTGNSLELPPKRLVYAAASDFAPDASHVPPGGPRPVHLLKRGDIHKPGPAAVPGASPASRPCPGASRSPIPKDEAPRRAALARWLTDPRNPLTWRSIVNRVWQHHFGRGIVETPNDFGRMGSLPTHPELLDWLAGRFLADGRLAQAAAPADRDERRVPAGVRGTTRTPRRSTPTTACSGGRTAAGSTPNRSTTRSSWPPAGST